MTREEAIAVLEESKRQNEIMRDNPTTFWASYQIADGIKNTKRRIDALDAALSALRPVSREQVEKGEWIFRPYEKMLWCTQAICSECGSVVENNSSLSQESGIKLFVESNPFCRRCGAPMTDEAVEMVMKRMEALEDAD